MAWDAEDVKSVIGWVVVQGGIYSPKGAIVPPCTTTRPILALAVPGRPNVPIWGSNQLTYTLLDYISFDIEYAVQKIYHTPLHLEVQVVRVELVDPS